MDPRFTKLLLPMNISEAVIVDLRAGYRDNARAGWTLIANPPGASRVNPTTGEGPTRFSEDRKAIVLGLPLAEKWDDLYATWNMAFVARYGYFPYVVTKLLIPQVAAYHDDPDEYMYNRVLALYAHENWLVLGLTDDTKAGVPSPELSLKWADPQLRTLWGLANQKSAHQYEQELSSIDPRWGDRFEGLASRFNRLR